MIATTAAIQEKSAHKFAVAFYKALVTGLSFGDAYKEAKVCLGSDDSTDAGIMRLHVNEPL